MENQKDFNKLIQEQLDNLGAWQATLWELENNRPAFFRQCMSNGMTDTNDIMAEYLEALDEASNKILAHEIEVTSIEERLVKSNEYFEAKKANNKHCACGKLLAITNTSGMCRKCNGRHTDPNYIKPAPIKYKTFKVKKKSQDLMDKPYCYSGGSFSPR